MKFYIASTSDGGYNNYLNYKYMDLLKKINIDVEKEEEKYDDYGHKICHSFVDINSIDDLINIAKQTAVRYGGELILSVFPTLDHPGIEIYDDYRE